MGQQEGRWCLREADQIRLDKVSGRPLECIMNIHKIGRAPYKIDRASCRQGPWHDHFTITIMSQLIVTEKNAHKYKYHIHVLQYICAQACEREESKRQACKTHMFENLVSGVEDPSTPSAFGHDFLSLYTICIPTWLLLLFKSSRTLYFVFFFSS